jgi:hypothetical protein
LPRRIKEFRGVLEEEGASLSAEDIDYIVTAVRKAGENDTESTKAKQLLQKRCAGGKPTAEHCEFFDNITTTF